MSNIFVYKKQQDDSEEVENDVRQKILDATIIADTTGMSYLPDRWQQLWRESDEIKDAVIDAILQPLCAEVLGIQWKGENTANYGQVTVNGRECTYVRRNKQTTK